jgi:hypothetical protein
MSLILNLKAEYKKLLDFSKVNTHHIIRSKPDFYKVADSRGVQGVGEYLFRYEFDRFGKVRVYNPYLVSREIQTLGRQAMLLVFRDILRNFRRVETSRHNSVMRILRRGTTERGNSAKQHVFTQINLRSMIGNKFRRSINSNINRAMANNNAFA